MNHKKTIGIIFIAAMALGVFGFLDPKSFRPCVDVSCDIFVSYLTLSTSLLVISTTLFFVRREVFIAWAKFAGVAFPIMLAILLYTFNNEPTYGGFGLGGLIPDELFASVTLPPLFLIISLLIIGIKSWKLRGSGN